MREEGGQCDSCGYYLKNIIKFLISHIGLVSLVIGYTIVGAFTFERLEAEHELQIKKNMSSVRLKVSSGDYVWCRCSVSDISNGDNSSQNKL